MAVIHIADSNNKERCVLHTAKHLKQVLSYICNPEKTQNGSNIISGGCFPNAQDAYEMFMRTKQDFTKTEGRMAYHWEICFPPGEADAATALDIAERWTQEILGDNYEYLIVVDKHFCNTCG